MRLQNPAGLFDVGAVTRELQAEFALFDLDREDGIEQQNTATPEHLAVLLASLDSMTRGLQERRRNISGWLPDAAVRHWDRTMLAWLVRLATYQAQVAKAPPGDRQDVLWGVTAPLLLGFYGGPNSTSPQRTIDAVTPFQLANGLTIDAQWRAEQGDRLLADLAEGAGAVVDVALDGVWALAPVVVGAGLVVLAWRTWRRGR